MLQFEPRPLKLMQMENLQLPYTYMYTVLKFLS